MHAPATNAAAPVPLLDALIFSYKVTNSPDIVYKGYSLKKATATGEIDIYAVGGARIQHAVDYETAKAYIDGLGKH